MSRKLLAVVITASLLISQQGFFCCEALAGVVASQAGVSVAPGTAAGGAGASLFRISVGGLGLQGAGPSGAASLRPSLPTLDLQAPAAAIGGKIGVSRTASVETSAVQTPAAAASAIPVPGAAAVLRPAHTAPAAGPAVSKAPAAAPAGSAAASAAASVGRGRAASILGRLGRAAGPSVGIRRFRSSSLGRMFDGAGRRRASAGTSAADPSETASVARGVRPENIRVYLTRHGGDPVPSDLASMGEVLASDPAYLQSLNEAGRIRLVVNNGNPDGGLTQEDADGIRSILESYGVTAKIDVENIPIDWKRKAAEAEAGKEDGDGKGESVRRGALWRYLIGPLTAPVREAAYLARTLAASFTKPTWQEILGGVVSKAPPMILGVIWYMKMFMPAFPWAFAAAIGLSLALNVFHGIWINTWANFQNNIGRQRGIKYQTFFNLFYVQTTGALFRIITWAVIAGTIAPWTLQYWRDMGIATLVGTFFGTLGYQGLNGLYDKGRLPRLGRSWIQQARDLFMTLGGVFFGTNSMLAFWILFITQQTMDAVIYTISRRVKKRSIVYMADRGIAATDEFQGMYPVKPGPEVSPLKQALDAVLDIPLFKPFVALFKWLYRVLRGKKKAGK